MAKPLIHDQPTTANPPAELSPATAEPTRATDEGNGAGKTSWKTAVREPRWIAVLLTLTLIGSLGYQWWADPQRHFELGMAGVRENNREQIERAVAALEGEPTYQAQHAFLTASLRMRDGQPEQALPLAIRSQEHPDVDIQARVLAGEAAYRLGAAGNAKAFWEDALLLDAQCVEAHQWLGVLYFDLGAMDNAILHLQAVSRLSPQDHRPDRLMGLINHDYERPEVAIPHYLESLRRAPRQPGVDTVWLELAECQIKQRQYEAAMTSLSHCPDSPRQKRLVARCLMNLGSLDAARRLAQQTLAAEPDDLKALQINAEIALIDGDTQRAADLLRKGVQVDPYDHGARTQLAQILGRLGLDEESRQQSQRADELQELWQRFSDLQIDAINRPTDAELRLEIGTLAQKLGKKELAVSWFKAALAIDPGMARAAQALAAHD